MDVIGFGAINLDEMYSVRSLAALPGLAVAPGSERIVDADEYGELTRLLEEADTGRLVSGGGEHHRLRTLALSGARAARRRPDGKGLTMTVCHGRTRGSGKVPLCLNVLLHSCSRESSEGISVYRLAYCTG
jgi:hypothetical protein